VTFVRTILSFVMKIKHKGLEGLSKARRIEFLARRSRRQRPVIPGLLQFFDISLAVFPNLCHTACFRRRSRWQAAFNHADIPCGAAPAPERRLGARDKVCAFTGIRGSGFERNRTALGGKRKNALGGQRKSLKRLDSDKEIKVNSFAILGSGLAGFG
jgi:hypothetical protein